MAIKGYWKLNGNSNDASGFGNNGTDTAITYSQANGRLNQGAGFNGISSKIVFSNQVIPLGEKSICFWFKSTNTSLYKVIVDNSNSNSTIVNGTYIDVRASTGYPIFISTKATSGIYRFFITIPQNITDGKWHFVVFTWDGTTNANGVMGYVDAILKVQGTASAIETSNANNNLNVGYAIDAGFTNGRMIGSLDKLKIKNTAISPAMIKNELSRVKGFF